MNDYEQDLYNGPLPGACGDPRPQDLAITPRFSLSNTNLSNLGRARLLLARLIGHDVKIKTKKSDGRSRPAYSIELASHFDVDTTLWIH